jgi:DNA-binding NarL/FixJ family response regulator
MGSGHGGAQMIRILVADDHDVVRRGLRNLFHSHGWEVCCEAATGDEAVAAAEHWRPDVAVLDAMMPGLDGLAATRQIRARVPQTEVLIFTMHETEELVADVLSSGAHGYVLKTDPSRHLLAAVEALARHACFITPSISDALVGSLGGRRGGRGTRSPLTGREREVVRLLAHGRANRDVAGALGISVKTVESHRSNLMRKLELGSIVDLVRYAVRNRLVEP